MSTAEVVVVGTGAMGAATTYFLAREQGITDVVLLDKDGPAAGASGRTGALIRMHYTNPYDATLALKSLEMFANWPDVVGGKCGFKKTGFLCLVSPADVEGLKLNTAMLKSVGVNTWTVSVEEVLLMQPFLSAEALGGAAYEPDGGYADGWSTTHSLAEAASGLGVRMMRNTTATRLIIEGERVRGVETSQGTIESDTVVLTAGGWSGRLAETAGLHLPLQPTRITAAILERPQAVPEHMVYIDMSLGFYIRQESADMSLVGIRSITTPAPVNPDDDDQTIEQSRINETLLRVTKRIPAMESARLRRTWTGVDGNTPDGHMLLGPAGIEGLFVATGGSGTGFKTAPAVGKAMAELVTSGKVSFMDLSPFRLTRFDEGKPIEDVYRYGTAWPI